MCNLAPSSSSSSPSRERVIVLAGPTGVGKSALALELARRLGGEVISADSVQVYRGLDIGSNKASEAERRAVPHHLLDVREPRARDMSAGEFFQLARRATADVLSRGRVPIVVGGTMMYMRWFMHGKPATPAPTGEAVERVRRELAEDGGVWEHSLARLRDVDPLRADALSRNDWYRLRRALEVARTAGIGISALPLRGGAPDSRLGDAAGARAERDGDRERRAGLDYDFRCVFLFEERERLYRRIDARCEQMVARGLLHETAQHLMSSSSDENGAAADTDDADEDADDPNEACSAARAIGYRHALHFLRNGYGDVRRGDDQTVEDGEASHGDSVIRAAAVDAFYAFLSDFQRASRQYARRQLQWYRAEQRFAWVHAARPDLARELVRMYEASAAEYARHLDTDEENARARAQSLQQGQAMKRYCTALHVFHERARVIDLLASLAPS